MPTEILRYTVLRKAGFTAPAQQMISSRPLSLRPRRVKSLTDVTRRFRQLRYLLLNQPAHRRYVNETNGYIDRGIARDGLYQRHKYLGDYLARSLNPKTRRAMILSHYRFVGQKVANPALHRITGSGIKLWEQSFGTNRATIMLTISAFAPMEGEWQLQFIFDDVVLCTLSFLFASVPHFDLDGEVVCLIGGVQGGLDCRTSVRIAAKANHEIAPTAMLILAVKATAQALGVETVFGVSSADRIAVAYAADRITADYDATWNSIGATRRNQGFFDLSHDLTERELSDIPVSHRRRTKVKRQRKAALLVDITEAAKKALLG